MTLTVFQLLFGSTALKKRKLVYFCNLKDSQTLQDVEYVC
jgi:hypothetical protein